MIEKNSARKDEILSHYIRGYLEGEQFSPYSAAALEQAARDDFDEWFDKEEDRIHEAGHEAGYKLAWDEANDEMRQSDEHLKKLEDELHRLSPVNTDFLESRVKRLEQELATAERFKADIFEKLRSEFEALTVSDSPNINDVEKWAHQDGWNEAVEKIGEALARVKSAS